MRLFVRGSSGVCLGYKGYILVVMGVICFEFVVFGVK